MQLVLTTRVTSLEDIDLVTFVTFRVECKNKSLQGHLGPTGPEHLGYMND